MDIRGAVVIRLRNAANVRCGFSFSSDLGKESMKMRRRSVLSQCSYVNREWAYSH